MDKLLVKNCYSCINLKKQADESPCMNCIKNADGTDCAPTKYEPNDTIKEIDRLIKLGRRYDTDTEINRVKECRWAKEVK